MKFIPGSILMAAALVALPSLGAPSKSRAAPPAPPQHLEVSQLGIVINDDDPASVEVGRYYRRARGVSAGNVVHVHLPGHATRLSVTEFTTLKASVDAQLNPGIEAIVFIWTAPYAVECQSITAAFTVGFDPALCRSSCAPSRASPYFDSASSRPYSYRRMRLSMLLPTESFAQSKALIDRGIKSDGRMPQGTAYFLTTTDRDRNTRTPFFPADRTLMWPPVSFVNLHADSIADKTDVMFYFTGAIRVPKLQTLTFVPGAIADHLTSTGGDLRSNGQMSSLEWLNAGATASYGTVSEPCNYWQKFPNPTVLLKHYLGGEPVIEAYWKSVAWPSQGVFIGEPMAAPYRR